MRKVNNVFLWERLRKKFDLSDDGRTEIPSCTETITLQTDADELHRDRTSVQELVSVTATGAKSFTAIPAGKRRRIDFVYVYVNSGTFTFDRVTLRRVKSDGTISAGVLLAAISAGQTSMVYNLKDFVMQEGDLLQVTVDGFTGAGDLGVTYSYAEEDWKR